MTQDFVLSPDALAALRELNATLGYLDDHGTQCYVGSLRISRFAFGQLVRLDAIWLHKNQNGLHRYAITATGRELVRFPHLAAEIARRNRDEAMTIENGVVVPAAKGVTVYVSTMAA